MKLTDSEKVQVFMRYIRGTRHDIKEYIRKVVKWCVLKVKTDYVNLTKWYLKYRNKKTREKERTYHELERELIEAGCDPTLANLAAYRINGKYELNLDFRKCCRALKLAIKEGSIIENEGGQTGVFVEGTAEFRVFSSCPFCGEQIGGCGR